jgi:cell division protein FtsB
MFIMKVGRYLVAFTVFMGILIVFGNRGLIDNYKMLKHLDDVKKKNQEITTENYEIKKKILLLRSNLPYIEMIARNELGMVRKGDIVYRFAK